MSDDQREKSFNVEQLIKLVDELYSSVRNKHYKNTMADILKQKEKENSQTSLKVISYWWSVIKFLLVKNYAYDGAARVVILKHYKTTSFKWKIWGMDQSKMFMVLV